MLALASFKKKKPPSCLLANLIEVWETAPAAEEPRPSEEPGEHRASLEPAHRDSWNWSNLFFRNLSFKRSPREQLNLKAKRTHQPSSCFLDHHGSVVYRSIGPNRTKSGPRY